MVGREIQMATIESQIEEFIVRELMLADDNLRLDPDQSLLQDGTLDSLGILRAISFLEERFGVSIEDGELLPENFSTIRSMKELVESKRRGM